MHSPQKHNFDTFPYFTEFRSKIQLCFNVTYRAFSDKLNPMNTKVLYTLEFNKIIERLADFASSELGKERALQLVPTNILPDIELSQSHTEDALKRILTNGNISFRASKELQNCFGGLKRESTLSTRQLLHIASFLESVQTVKSYGKRDDDNRDSLQDYFDALYPLTPVCSEIRKCILDEDLIADNASSELFTIRRKIKSVNDKIHTQLSKMVSSTYSSYLQDSLITMRDSRYCLPVKAEYKSNVPGMVHDQSASASTFFIEPAAVVNMNNELKQLSLDEEREIQVILANLSGLLGTHIPELTSNIDAMAHLDCAFAKGNLALAMNAHRPVYDSDNVICLKKARHPLLDPEKVVPIDVSLGKDYDLLVITGPNTGGKTVTLKTVGLLCLMGQAGLHIPAADHSTLKLFNEVYADIGDEQSIEQSLSTFSSHMKTIVEILQNADDKSLCLFDELGAGTDPTEGAALAISILSKLHQNGICSIATTHYSELKMYALSEEGVENAGCEFDVESLRPTYRLITGIPGKSNAFAISSKLGLSEDIIDDAKKRLTTQDKSFEDILAQLHDEQRVIEEDKRKIEGYKHDIEMLKSTYEQRKEKMDASRDKIINAAKEEAAAILKEAKETADEAIREMHKAQKNGGDFKRMEQQRTKLRDAAQKTQKESAFRSVSGSHSYKASDFTLGMMVKILSMNLTGTVHTLPDNKGNLFVQCGIMNMQTNIKDLEIVPEENDFKPTKGKASVSGTSSLSKASSISAEIKLLGMTQDEAIAVLDKYLDDAYLSHLSSVRVVHGKGTGALRAAVVKHLKSVSYVKSFRQAEYGEGDAGVTIVEFK